MKAESYAMYMIIYMQSKHTCIHILVRKMLTYMDADYMQIYVPTVIFINL